MQGVESVKELFLGGILASDELNIVYQEHIHLAIFFTECRGGFVADGIDQVVGEFLRGNIEHNFSLFDNFVADRVQDVGFS